MFIKQIHIQNYKNISDYTYTPDNKIVVFAGPNGKGKTSIKEAIFGAFTGIFPNNCIRENQDTMTITVYLDDSTMFSRSYSRTTSSVVKLNGRVTTAKSLEEFLQHKYGLNKTELSYSLSEDIVSHLKSTELGEFLLSKIPEETTITTMLNYCDKVEDDVKKE